MPNVQAAERFMVAGTGVENRFVAAAQQIWADARPQLFDLISRGQDVYPVIRQVGRDLASAGTALVPEAELIVTRYLGSQLLQVRSTAQAVEIFDQFALARPLESGLRAWQAGTMGRFLSDIGRLELAGETAAAIGVALTAPLSAVPSTYSASANALQLAVEEAVWQALNGSLRASYLRLAAAEDERGYQKQAIAALDGRTTRCCIGVHGQIRDLDKPFTTSGRPAYASEQMQSPFHHRCRTVITLYTPLMETIGVSTADLRAAASAELSRR